MKKGNFAKKIIAALLTACVTVSATVGFGTVDAQAAAQTKLSGKAHVQTFGDTAGKVTTTDGYETLVLGTRGQAKRVESITVNFTNNTGYSGTIQYKVHRQTYGWTDWVNAGNPAGTTGQGKRLEGLRMRLTGELAEHYNIEYRVHIQTYGDNQGWVRNGALAGTTGEAKRLEEVQVRLVPKNQTETATVSYRVHRQTYGWETAWAKNGSVSGTVGQAKRLEGITIHVNSAYDGSIRYKTHVQSDGWKDWSYDGEMSGTSGEAKRLEAIKIELTGELAEHYDVYYRVHAQSYGWMAWAKNGEAAGTAGYGKRLEAIQIVLVAKENAAPATTYAGVTQASSKPYVSTSGSSTSSTDGNTSNTDNTTGTGSTVGTYHAAKTQTVTWWVCDACELTFQTEEELNEHFAANDPKYNIVSDCANKKGTQKTQTYTIQEAYTETAEGCVPTLYQMVWVEDQPEWDETVMVYSEVKERWICRKCGLVGIYDEVAYHDCPQFPFSYYNEYYQDELGIETVHHPAIGHWEKQAVQ